MIWEKENVFFVRESPWLLGEWCHHTHSSPLWQCFHMSIDQQCAYTVGYTHIRHTLILSLDFKIHWHSSTPGTLIPKLVLIFCINLYRMGSWQFFTPNWNAASCESPFTCTALSFFVGWNCTFHLEIESKLHLKLPLPSILVPVLSKTWTLLGSPLLKMTNWKTFEDGQYLK